MLSKGGRFSLQRQRRVVLLITAAGILSLPAACYNMISVLFLCYRCNFGAFIRADILLFGILVTKIRCFVGFWSLKQSHHPHSETLRNPVKSTFYRALFCFSVIFRCNSDHFYTFQHSIFFFFSLFGDVYIYLFCNS